MSTEIASAYVSIGASTKGIGRQVKGEFSGVEAAADKTGGRIGASLSRAMKTGAIAVGLVGGAIIGLAAKGGFDRALAIDNAQAKMKALGYSGKQITDVMNEALGSVKGTAFGLGDAASLATQYIAAGVQPGKDLSRALGDAADLAAVANVSLGDLAPVMGQLSSSSHLYTQDLLQLQSRGLPVFGWLADSLGTTQDNVRDMVSSGKISFAQLQTAIEQHIGGAAKATDSFAASWSNTKAAFSRVGALFATPTLAILKKTFDSLIPVIDVVGAKLEPLAEILSSKLGYALTVVTDHIGRLVSGKESFGDLLTGAIGNISPGALLAKIVPALSGVLTKAADWLAHGGIEMLAQGFLKGREALIDAILKIAPSIIGALSEILPEAARVGIELIGSITTILPGLATAVLAMVPSLLQAAVGLYSSLVTALAQMLPNLISTLVGVLPQLLSTIVAMIPALLQAALSAFSAILTALVAILPELVTTLLGMLPGLIGTLLGMVPQLLDAGLAWFTQLLNAVVTVLPELLTTLLTDVLPAVLTTILAMLPDLLTAAITTFFALVDALTTVLPDLIQTLVGTVLPNLIQTLVDMVPVLIPVAIKVFLALVDGLIKVIPTLVKTVGVVIFALIGALIEAVPKLLAASFDLMLNIGQGLRNAWPTIWGWLKGLPGEIMGIFSDAGQWLRDAGRHIIEGLIGGLKDAFTKVKDTLGKLTDLLPSWKGPATVDAKLLTGSGRLIMRSLVSGFDAEAPTVQRYLQGFTADLAAAGSANVNVTAAGQAGIGSGSGLTYEQLVGAMREFARQFALTGKDIADGRIDVFTRDVKAMTQQGVGTVRV